MNRLIFTYIFLFLIGCASDVKEYSLEPPKSFPELVAPDRNPFSESGVLLGEQLFSDPILSTDSSISCISCHKPELAFTDGMDVSNLGASGSRLLRNTPTLINVAWSSELFWDGGAHDLESQVFGPLLHSDEMGEDLGKVIEKLNESSHYKALFEDAFGTDSITSKYVARALAQYERTIWSANSKYDAVIAGEGEFSEPEARGQEIFMMHCVTCHPAPLFTDNKFHNVGLDSVFNADKDGIYLGRFRISHDSIDIGSFKTPTLRNVAVTAPYMHDGRYPDLEAVIDHYSGGVIQSQYTSKKLPRVQFNEDEVSVLVAFLESLTDEKFIKQ